MSNRAIVLDANILIRAVLGKRVRELLIEHAATVKFFAPDVAYADARKHVPALLTKRGISSSAAISVLDGLQSIVQPIDFELSAGQQQQALQRIAIRDADNWTVLACAITIGCPVWTVNSDFFAAGVAIRTTDRVEWYLAG